MKNDIVFKNIFLNDVVTSTIKDFKRSLNEIKDSLCVGDNGEWNFKLNTALESFKDFDIYNFNLKQLEYIISESYDFIELINNTTPQEKEEIVLLKDYSFKW